MIEKIKLPRKQFEVWGNEKNWMGKLTNETVIICQNAEVKGALRDQFFNKMNKTKLSGNTKDKPKLGINFLLRTEIIHGSQRITLSLEPSAIYQVFEAEDIWFAGYKYKDWEYTKMIEVYPFCCYKDYEHCWSKGIRHLYLNVVNGKIGCYTGEWVKRGDTI